MGKNHFHQAFPTPLYRRVWTGVDDVNEALRQLILARMPDTPQDHRSNVGGWHSANDLLSWDAPEIKQLVEWIRTALREADEQGSTAKARPDSRVTLFAWANVLHDGGYNRVHDHDTFTWSGVYYVDAGEGVLGDGMNGHLEFVDPRTGVGETFSSVLRLRPESGTMVLFPAWLKHFVHPYRGARPRISIAFNVKIEPRQNSGGGS